MNWTRYLYHDYYTANELNRIDERMRKQRMSDARMRSSQSDRIAELEDEVDRLALMVHSLAEMCIESGAFTRDQLRAMLHKEDAADGKVDGRMGPPKPESQAPETPHEFLGKLEERDR